MPAQDRKFFFPRDWFTDSLGREFADKRWADFVMAMDKYAEQYMTNLEKVLDKEYS